MSDEAIETGQSDGSKTAQTEANGASASGATANGMGTQADLVSLPRSEYDKYLQSQQGFAKWSDRLKKFGIDDIDDEHLGVVAELRKRQGKVKPQDIIGALSEFDAAEEEVDGKPINLTPRQLREMIEKETEQKFNTRWDQRTRAESAQREYERMLQQEDEALAEIRKELGIPDKIEDGDLYNRLLDAAVMGMRVELHARNGFIDDEGHPLKGRARPLSREAFAEMKKMLTEGRELFKAREQIEMAKRASKGRKPETVQQETQLNNETVEDAEEKERQAILKRLNESRKARGREPISQSA